MAIFKSISHEELVEVAKAISPYAWNDLYWVSDGRHVHYSRNQEHAKKVAIQQAGAAVLALHKLGLIK